MRKTILSFICALAILSACEKINLNDPSTSPAVALKSTTPADSTVVVTPPPSTNTPIVIPAPVVTTPPANSPIVIPPVGTPPVVAHPIIVIPPVGNPPVGNPPVVTPPVVKPPVVTPPVTTPPVTTPPVVTGLSFSKDVIPVLSMCENCHTHGWTPSAVASTYYTNLVNSGYVKPSSYTSSAIYSKLSSGHPGAGSISTVNTDKIITWMKQGSLNN